MGFLLGSHVWLSARGRVKYLTDRTRSLPPQVLAASLVLFNVGGVRQCVNWGFKQV